MGGKESLDYLAPSGSGENTLVTCENGDYAADLEIALGVPRAPDFPERLDAPDEVETPDTRTCEALAELLSIDLRGDHEGDAGRQGRRHARARARCAATTASRRRSCQAALGSDFRPATDEEIVAGFGAEGGSLGPVGFNGPVVADETLREGQFVSGANRTGWHLRGVEAGRDYQPEFADIRQPREGDACPECGGRLGFQTAIEVGHIFKLGTRYSEAFGAKYLDEDGAEKPIVMGSYGIGPGRVLAAAVEQHGERGRDRLAGRDRPVRRPRGRPRLGQPRAGRHRRGGRRRPSRPKGSTSCSTTASCGPGEKFADADLIGCPLACHRRQENARGRRRGPQDRTSGDESRIASLDLAKRVVARADGQQAEVQRRGLRRDDRAPDGGYRPRPTAGSRRRPASRPAT